MLFNFQGPCTFNKFFVCFSSALFILPHSKAFVKTFFKLFSNFFKKFFELFVNLQSRNQSVLYSLFALFSTEKPLSFSSLSCDSSNILSYLQAIVKTFLNFFLKFFEFSLNFDSGIQSSEHSFSTLVFLENRHFFGFFRRSFATACL